MKIRVAFGVLALVWFAGVAQSSVRAEQTNVKAAGPRSDPTLNFQRNSSGQVVLTSTGAPALIVPTSNALGVSQLTYLDRGANVRKEYLRLFPSVNVGYTFNEDWVARAAYFQSVGRPDFIQYTGGITLPDTTVPSVVSMVEIHCRKSGRLSAFRSSKRHMS